MSCVALWSLLASGLPPPCTTVTFHHLKYKVHEVDADVVSRKVLVWDQLGGGAMYSRWARNLLYTTLILLGIEDKAFVEIPHFIVIILYRFVIFSSYSLS